MSQVLTAEEIEKYRKIFETVQKRWADISKKAADIFLNRKDTDSDDVWLLNLLIKRFKPKVNTLLAQRDKLLTVESVRSWFDERGKHLIEESKLYKERQDFVRKSQSTLDCKGMNLKTEKQRQLSNFFTGMRSIEPTQMMRDINVMDELIDKITGSDLLLSDILPFLHPEI